MDNCNLLDMGFSGDPYTWVRGNTRKRLDRALSNLEWRLRFTESTITHLPKLKSDHAPLLMNFGNIFTEKKALLKKLKNIDKRLQNNWNDYWLNIQKSTWNEYEEILAKEEILWYLKSRAKWIEFGDRNTKYFHGVTTIRRRKNHTSSLQNSQGVRISDHFELERVLLIISGIFSTQMSLWPLMFLKVTFLL